MVLKPFHLWPDLSTDTIKWCHHSSDMISVIKKSCGLFDISIWNMQTAWIEIWVSLSEYPARRLDICYYLLDTLLLSTVLRQSQIFDCQHTIFWFYRKFRTCRDCRDLEGVAAGDSRQANVRYDNSSTICVSSYFLQFVHYFCGMVFGKYLHNEMS